MLFKKKIKVTAQQLGKILFIYVYTCVETIFEDKEEFEKLHVENVSMLNLREMIIINMFLVMITTRGLLRDEAVEREALKHMNISYYEWLELSLNFSNEEVLLEHAHVGNRFKEYEQALDEKRGPGWLYPLTEYMLNNLRQEKTKDADAQFFLHDLVVKTIKATQKLIINEYEVVKH